MQEYIFQGHTSKLSKTEAKTTAPITNYLSHHRCKNINKTDKIRIAFDLGAKIQYKSLNKHFLKGLNYLNNLRFRQRKYAVMVNIAQIFHQIRVLTSDSNALSLLYTAF